MAYAQKDGKYFRAFYKSDELDPVTGKHKIKSSRTDDNGDRFTTKTAAEKWGEEQEVLIRRKLIAAPVDDITVQEWFELWWPSQDLGLRSRGNYAYLFSAYILPEWGHRNLKSIKANEVNAWEQRLKALYKQTGVPIGARTKFATLLGDAVLDGRIDSNPALRQRRRGRRSGVGTGGRGAEKTWTKAVEALLFAERLGVLGRDDDFVFGLTLAYTGMRWGEIVGLQPNYVRPGKIRVDWQLEEVGGKFFLLPPKDDSNRDVDTPPFLSGLLSELLQARSDQRCRCKPVTIAGQQEQPCQGGARWVFLGPRLGHPRNSNYARDFIDPAADGRYPEEKGKRHRPARRVLVNLGEGTVWPGDPWPHWESTIGRGRSGSRVYDPDDESVALAEWTAIAEGLSAHGLRHAQSTWLADLGVDGKLRDDRLGHVTPGMRGLYTHISDEARAKLRAALQEVWETSLAARAWYGLRSPVPMLDRLLTPFRDGRRSPVSPVRRGGEVVPLLVRTTG